MNTLSFLRNAFVALSLGAFLITGAHAGLDDQDFETTSSSALVPVSPEVPSDAADDTFIRKVQQNAGTITVVLPQEILQHIFRFLSVKEATRAKETCVAFYRALSSPEYAKSFQIVQFLYRLKKSEVSSPLVDTLLAGPLLKVKVGPGIIKESITDLGFFSNDQAYTSLCLNNYTGILPENALGGISNLSLLKFSNYTGPFSSDSFSASRYLKSLFLSHYTGGDLPEKVFDGLKFLTYLTLSHCTGTLPKGVFDKLELLGSLFLDSYTGRNLPEGVFDRLAALETLNLNHYTGGDLPEKVFDGLTNLRNLYLGKYTGTIPAGIFDGLRSLQNLYLVCTHPLPAGIFDGPGLFLEKLDLVCPPPLPKGVFNNLTRLQELHLDHRTDTFPESLTRLSLKEMETNHAEELSILRARDVTIYQ